MRGFLLITKCVSKKLSFSNLVWEDGIGILNLKNGYQVVVRTGKGTATTVGSPFEFELVPQNSIISDDRIGYCTEEEITELIKESQSLPKLK